MSAGRPLRFVGVTLGGWIAIRAFHLWPVAEPLPMLAAEIEETLIAAPAPSTAPTAAATLRRPHIALLRKPAMRHSVDREPVDPSGDSPLPHATERRELALGLVSPVTLGTLPLQGPGFIAPSVLQPGGGASRRLAGSGWLIARGGGAAAPFTPQLGGGQAGARLTYAIDDAGRLSLAARFSAALGTRQREGAIGLDWKPTALPLRLIAEQRIGIEDARGGPALGLIGGIPPTPVAAGFAIEGYVQMGAIARAGVEGYLDGALRVARPVGTIGAARLDLGLGAWGGAQRGASRLDLGPSASLSLPTGGPALRVSVEWRQRVAGAARPGSGAALSIGTDF